MNAECRDLDECGSRVKYLGVGGAVRGSESACRDAEQNWEIRSDAGLYMLCSVPIKFFRSDPVLRPTPVSTGFLDPMTSCHNFDLPFKKTFFNLKIAY